MYSAVHKSLRRGCCLGIFPEGGSHDRTDLLPLKAGVAIIALDAYNKHGLQVPIVPVGLNYFAGHKFGGRVVVEFGAPIHITEPIHAQYETDRRGATEALLKYVTTGMRSVIVPVPDYHTLQQIYMVRRLYVPEGVKLSAGDTMDLNRRFAVGTFRIMQLARGSAGTSSEPGAEDGTEAKNVSESPLEPEDICLIDNVRRELKDYMASLKKLGIRDHQVQQLAWWSKGDLVGKFFYLMVTMALGLIPHVLFNLPVMMLASYLARGDQRKSLKASTVKLQARDVVLSFKIIYVLVFVPFLFLIYGTLIWQLTSWTATSRFVVLMSLPFFAFLGMKASEQGMKALKDIVPLFERAFYSSCRKEQDLLPGRRAVLQRHLISTVKTFGPRLGDLYRQKEVDWSKEISPLETAMALRDLLAPLSQQQPAGNGADASDMESRIRRLRASSGERCKD
jgi:glycerol-3-phosphate O-acyltransferase/dihydroxyacetone phosphate acyltransferase